MLLRPAIALSALSVALLGGCATSMSGPSASADLQARSGSAVAGKVSFSETNGRLRVEAMVSGLTPGEHGFHIHEKGDCSAPDGTSAGGHFNPSNKPHGNPEHGEHHGGDMPQLVADAKGVAKLLTYIEDLEVAESANGIIGRSVIVHATADDFKTQPTGNSGARFACGVIVKK